jgi:putative transcription factor
VKQKVIKMASSLSSHQDWTPVVISGKKNLPPGQTKYNIEEKKSDAEKSRLAKSFAIENETEIFQTATIPHALSQEIIQARTAKGLTQKQLANMIHVQQSIIASYENGKAIPDNQLLQKIAKGLGVKFVNKIIKPQKST